MITHSRGWQHHCWVRGLIKLGPDLSDDELAERLRKRIDARVMGREVAWVLDQIEGNTIFFPSRKRSA